MQADALITDEYACMECIWLHLDHQLVRLKVATVYLQSQVTSCHKLFFPLQPPTQNISNYAIAHFSCVKGLRLTNLPSALTSAK